MLEKMVYEPYECGVKRFLSPIKELCYCLVSLTFDIQSLWWYRLSLYSCFISLYIGLPLVPALINGTNSFIKMIWHTMFIHNAFKEKFTILLEH